MANFRNLFSSSFFALVLLVGFAKSDATEKDAHRLQLKKVSVNGAVASGSAGEVVLTFQIDPGFHVQANPASQPNLIATELKVPADVSQGVKWGTPTYPKGVKFKLQSAKREIMTYEGEFSIAVPVTFTKGVDVRGIKTVVASLRYQACDAIRCYFPKNLPVDLKLSPSP